MRIDVVTLFPEMVEHAATFGVTGRARERGLWQLGDVESARFRDRQLPHRRRPAVRRRAGDGDAGRAAGAGDAAARAAQAEAGVAASRTIYLSPAGKPLTHARVVELADAKDAGYVLLAGRYEGIDERLLAREVDEEIAIGDFVVSGGELPALMLIDAIVRQLPGALNDAAVRAARSRSSAGCSTARTTRGPRCTRAMAVPDVLLSGHHALIRRWRLKAVAGAYDGAAARPARTAGRCRRKNRGCVAEIRSRQSGDR